MGVPDVIFWCVYPEGTASKHQVLHRVLLSDKIWNGLCVDYTDLFVQRAADPPV